METKQAGKTINYFLVSVDIIKNGAHEIIENHAIKSMDSTPESGYNKLKDKIKAMRKQNYPGDTCALRVSKYHPFTKEQYEEMPAYLRQ
jgi:hypothetical protein